MKPLAATLTGITALALSLTTPADQSPASDDELFFDIPVVLSASRLSQPVSESPLAVTSIDREIIEASGARNIPELLRLVPGVVAVRAATEFGDEPQYSVAYHGHSDQYSRRMQVLIDGRSIYEPTLGGVQWKTVPINIEDIERIEVIRGPNSASFGANSFLAVVNIITRHAAEDQGQLLVAKAGNHDIRDVTYRYGGSNGDDIDFRITVTGQQDDGQDRVDNQPNNDGVEARVIDYRLDYQLDNHNTITWQGGYGITDQQVEENFSLLGIRPSRDSENITGHQFLKWENTTSSDNTYILQYYLNYFDRSDVSTSDIVIPATLGFSGDPFTLTLDFSLTSRRHNLEFTHHNRSLEDTELIWGVSTQLDEIESPYFTGPGNKIDRQTNRAFVNVAREVGASQIVQLGTLYEDNEFDGDRFSPRFSYIYKPSERHSFRFSISRAIRQPFLFESDADAFFTQDLTSGGVPTGDTIFYQQWLATPGLRTESIISRDIGYFGSLLDHALSVSVRLFNDDLEDLIDRQEIAGVPPHNVAVLGTNTFSNLYRSNVRGVEAEMDLKVSAATRVYTSVALFDIDSNDARIAKSAPKQSASLMGIFDLSDSITLSSTVHYISDMSFTDVNNSAPNGDDTGDYTVLDLRLSKRFRLDGRWLTVSITGQNLLDEYNGYDSNPTSGPLLEENAKWYLEIRMQSH